jgi:very-short-patch-repair endonuclease
MRPEIDRARELRRPMSEPEVILWSRLKRLRERGFHIRRQAPLRGYFLDFVCYARRLVIEVDGAQHTEDGQAEHDAIRDRILEWQGFRVMRIPAGEIRRNLSLVMDQIVLALEAAPVAHRHLSSNIEPERDFPTLAASRPVPPH